MHNLSGISNIQTNMFQIELAYLQQMLEMTSVMNYEVYTEVQLLILLGRAHETLGSDDPLTKHHISEEWSPYIFCCFCGVNIKA
jgi:hypothetical protein